MEVSQVLVSTELIISNQLMSPFPSQSMPADPGRGQFVPSLTSAANAGLNTGPPTHRNNSSLAVAASALGESPRVSPVKIFFTCTLLYTAQDTFHLQWL